MFRGGDRRIYLQGYGIRLIGDADGLCGDSPVSRCIRGNFHHATVGIERNCCVFGDWAAGPCAGRGECNRREAPGQTASEGCSQKKSDILYRRHTRCFVRQGREWEPAGFFHRHAGLDWPIDHSAAHQRRFPIQVLIGADRNHRTVGIARIRAPSSAIFQCTLREPEDGTKK